MDWKERFDKKVGWLVDDKQGGWSVGRKELLDFISTEILEKLIAEIPKQRLDLMNAMADNAEPAWNHALAQAADKLNALEQQLRNKWL